MLLLLVAAILHAASLLLAPLKVQLPTLAAAVAVSFSCCCGFCCLPPFLPWGQPWQRVQPGYKPIAGHPRTLVKNQNSNPVWNPKLKTKFRPQVQSQGRRPLELLIAIMIIQMKHWKFLEGNKYFVVIMLVVMVAVEKVVVVDVVLVVGVLAMVFNTPIVHGGTSRIACLHCNCEQKTVKASPTMVNGKKNVRAWVQWF